MNDYVKALEEAVISGGELPSFDGHISILKQRVIDSINSETKEELISLMDSLSNMFYSIKIPTTINRVYNDPVDFNSLTDNQKAFYKGYFAAFTDIVSNVYSGRPSREELDYVKANVELLKECDGKVYEERFDELYSRYLINLVPHGKERYCTLSPFAKDVIKQYG